MLDAVFGNEMEWRVTAFGSSARRASLRSGRSIDVLPIQEIAHCRAASAYIFHYAYLGKEMVTAYGTKRFIAVNEALSDLVAGFCERMTSGGLFFASSGAAYYAAGSEDDPTRQVYGVSKVRDEGRFLGMGSENFHVCACRIFNMAGPFINKLSEYALSSILLDVQRGGPIRLRAQKPVVRSFVHVRDIVDVVLGLLLEGSAPSVPFDAAGPEPIEIGDLAARAAKALGLANARIERLPITSRVEDRYVGDAGTFQSLMERLGVEPAGLDMQIRDTAHYLASLLSEDVLSAD